MNEKNTILKPSNITKLSRFLPLLCDTLFDDFFVSRTSKELESGRLFYGRKTKRVSNDLMGKYYYDYPLTLIFNTNRNAILNIYIFSEHTFNSRECNGNKCFCQRLFTCEDINDVLQFIDTYYMNNENYINLNLARAEGLSIQYTGYINMCNSKAKESTFDDRGASIAVQVDNKIFPLASLEAVVVPFHRVRDTEMRLKNLLGHRGENIKVLHYPSYIAPNDYNTEIKKSVDEYYKEKRYI